MVRYFCLMFTAAVSGCGPSAGLMTDTLDTSTASGGDLASGGTITVPTTSTADASGSIGEEVTSDATTTMTGGDACEGRGREDVDAQWLIRDPKGVPEVNISARCSVFSVSHDDELGVVYFHCDPNEMSIELTTIRTPVQPLPFEVGDEVQLEYRSEKTPWFNEWFSIRTAANPSVMVLGGISADRVPPPGTSVQNFYFANLEVVYDLCPPEGLACLPSERLALDVDLAGDQQRVFDSQFAKLTNLSGEYRIWVQSAARVNDPSVCHEDTEPAWFQSLMTLNLGP